MCVQDAADKHAGAMEKCRVCAQMRVVFRSRHPVKKACGGLGRWLLKKSKSNFVPPDFTLAVLGERYDYWVIKDDPPAGMTI